MGRLPSNFVKIGQVVFRNPANKQTNIDEKITFLPEVMKEGIENK